MANVINQYGLDEKLKTVERGPVTLKQAERVVREYYSRADVKFDSAEKAVAATMFGFSRSESDFIEICVNGRTQISFKFEWQDPNAGKLGRIFGKGFAQVEQDLRSLDEVLQCTTIFFEGDPHVLLERLNGLKRRR